MAGRRSVFVCHVEKIYVKTPGEMRYVPGYAGVKPESIRLPPPTLFLHFTTLRGNSKRKLAEQFIIEYTSCIVIEILRVFGVIVFRVSLICRCIFSQYYSNLSLLSRLVQIQWDHVVCGSFWLAACEQRCWSTCTVDGRHPLLMLNNNRVHTPAERNEINRCAATHTHANRHATVATATNHECSLKTPAQDIRQK